VQHLVCFSKTLHNVIVYRVNYPFTKHNEAQQQPETVFNRFFSLKFDRNINIGEEILCRDFCLFTEDSRFVRFLVVLFFCFLKGVLRIFHSR